MPCMDYTELSPLQKLHFFFIWGTCYYFNQECGDLFDLIGNSMLKRMYVCQSSVLILIEICFQCIT